jgi:hypothetical protein
LFVFCTSSSSIQPTALFSKLEKAIRPSDRILAKWTCGMK